VTNPTDHHHRVLAYPVEAVEAAANYLPAVDLAKLARVSPAAVAEWTPRLRAALPVLHRVLRDLEQLERAAANPDGRVCAHCGGPLAEDSTSKYCRRSCRQRAYEARKESR
jgi:hypothetical protein